ncbi:MAG: hypothetical protein LUG66_00710 [Clostridiales bacterium]|nr:hypothetical protein [Clostridiales bacterium]
MSYEEFIEKMKKLGYDDDYINDYVEHAKEVSKCGIKFPLEMYLIELPTNYP